MNSSRFLGYTNSTARRKKEINCWWCWWMRGNKSKRNGINDSIFGIQRQQFSSHILSYLQPAIPIPAKNSVPVNVALSPHIDTNKAKICYAYDKNHVECVVNRAKIFVLYWESTFPVNQRFRFKSTPTVQIVKTEEKKNYTKSTKNTRCFPLFGFGRGEQHHFPYQSIEKQTNCRLKRKLYMYTKVLRQICGI